VPHLYPLFRPACWAVWQFTGPAAPPLLVGAPAAGAGRGPPGNSGLILAVALQGAADALAGVSVATADAMATALETASDRARAAVARPVDRTSLTAPYAIADDVQRHVEAATAPLAD